MREMETTNRNGKWYRRRNPNGERVNHLEWSIPVEGDCNAMRYGRRLNKANKGSIYVIQTYSERIRLNIHTKKKITWTLINKYNSTPLRWRNSLLSLFYHCQSYSLKKSALCVCLQPGTLFHRDVNKSWQVPSKRHPSTVQIGGSDSKRFISFNPVSAELRIGACNLSGVSLN